MPVSAWPPGKVARQAQSFRLFFADNFDHLENIFRWVAVACL